MSRAMGHRDAAWLICALLATPAFAHEDRILTVQADGAIPEVPAKFGKVRLTVERLGQDQPLIALQIDARRNVLPACVARLIRSRSPAQIEVFASWYHDQKLMPYYLEVRFYEPGFNRKAAFQPYQSFMFNLHNAALMESERMVVNRSGTGASYADFGLPAGCTMGGLNKPR